MRLFGGIFNQLTLLAAEVFLEGGAVTDIRPPPRTGDLLSSLAEK